MKKIEKVFDTVTENFASFLFVFLAWWMAICVGLANYSGFVIGVDLDKNILINYPELKIAMIYQAVLVSLTYNILLALLRVSGVALETAVVRLIKIYRSRKQLPAESEAPTETSTP